MEYNASKILRAFENTAHDVLLNNARQWYTVQHTHVQKLQGILNTIKINLVRNEEWPANPAKLWSGLRENLGRIHHWLFALQLLPEDATQLDFISDWDKRFNDHLSEFPDVLRILIGDSYWSVRQNDRSAVRVLKKLQPLRRRLRYSANHWMNTIRAILQRPPYRLSAQERKIHLHLFARYFINIPVREMLFSEWQKFLQGIFGQLFLIHKHLKDICKIALLNDELDLLYQDQENPATFNELYNLAEVLKEIDIAVQSLENYQQQLNRRWEQYWKDIAENFQSHWEKSGTFQFKSKKYNARKIEGRQYRLSVKTKRSVAAWQAQWNGFYGQWQKDIDLILIKFRLAEKLDQEYTNFNRNNDKIIGPAFRQVIDSLKKVDKKLAEINGSADINLTAIRDAISILRKLPGSELAQLLEIISHANPVRLPRSMLTFINDELADLHPDYLVYVFRDSEGVPPRSKSSIIPLADIVFTINKLFNQNYDHFVQQNLGKQEAGLRLVAKLDQMIGFNLQMAETSIIANNAEDRIPEIKNTLQHTVQHSQHSLTELEENFTQLTTSINEFFVKQCQQWEQKLTVLFENNHAFRFHRQIQKSAKRRKMLEKLSLLFRHISGFVLGLFKYLVLAVVDFWKTYILANQRDQTGKPAVELDREIKRFLTDTEDQISSLPSVYRNLFKFEPLANDRLYAAREAELAQLSSAFEHWQAGNPQSCAIIGEMGSGRTTLLNMAKEKLFRLIPVSEVLVKHPPVKIVELVHLLSKSTGIKKVTTMEGLIGSIQKEAKKQIGIIENVNNLFLRTVAGLEMIEQFLNMIHRTSDKIFWLVTGTPFSWQYLQKTVNIDTYFNSLVYLNSFSNGDIESIINARHKMSGFDVNFQPNGNIEENRKLRRHRTEESRQSYLRTRFFNKLNKISGGNVTVAMLYWLRAIREFSNERVILSVDLDFDFSFLELLSREELFSLAAIINHEDLTPFEHALIFQQSEEKSRLQLIQMMQSGLLVIREESYEIHPFLYRHLVELLRSRNIIY